MTNSIINHSESQMKRCELDALLSHAKPGLGECSFANALWALCIDALVRTETLRDLAAQWAYVRSVLPLFTPLAQSTLTTCAWRRLRTLRRHEARAREQAVMVAPALLQRGETYHGMDI